MKMPSPDIEIVGISNFEDFYDKEITLSDAQLILNNIKEKTYGFVATKTYWDIPFVRDLDLILHTGIAFIICELHRRENNHEALFQIFSIYNPRKNQWEGFYEDDELRDFSNLKANRSFLTYIYEYASNTEGLKSFAYSIATKFRGHKTDGVEESEITKHYLEVTRVNGYEDKVIYNIQRIGSFGFLYNHLTDLVYDTTNTLNEDKIIYLETLKDSISKKSIEHVADFLSKPNDDLNNINNMLIGLTDITNEMLDEKITDDLKQFNEFRINEQISLIKEISIISKDDVFKRLSGIVNNEANSKQPFSFCFIGIINCNKPTSSENNCIICKYSIPTIYAITSIKEDFDLLVDRIYQTSICDRKMIFKYKILFMKYISVLSAAYKEFQKYDSDFISTFIDIEKLKATINDIEYNIFSKAGVINN